MTTGFRLVDLGSQAPAVARHVAGWPRGRVLAWLALHGDDTFVFRSPYGPVTGFILTPAGEWFLIADHTALPVRPPGAPATLGTRPG